MSMLQIFFQLMSGYWSRRYTDRLAEKRESYTRIFFTVWVWFCLGLGLWAILEGIFKISHLPKLLGFGALAAAAFVVITFSYLWCMDYTKEHQRKKGLEKKIMEKANEADH